MSINTAELCESFEKWATSHTCQESCGQEQLFQAGQQAEALACRVTLDWVSAPLSINTYEHSASTPWDLVMYCQ